MWLSKMFILIYLIGVCAAQDPTEVPPSPLLQLKTAWLDVFPSEKVEFSCGIKDSSEWTFTLLRDGKNLASFPRDGSTLKVTAGAGGTERYSCVGHHEVKKTPSQTSSSVELRVYDNKPKPKISRSSSFDIMYTGESISFKCELTVSSGWEYLWYHNGKEISSSGDTLTKPSLGQSDDGQYECKAKRGMDPFFSEASEATSLQVSDPPTPTLTLQTPWHDVFENEVVEFTCELSSSIDWTFTWYRNNKKLSEDDVLIMDDDNLLNITSVSRAHQGQYACKAHLLPRGVSSGFSSTNELTVYEKIPEAALTKSPEYELMYVGETVNFTCKVSTSSGWTYVWYKDGTILSQTSQSISIYLSPSKEGEYYCLGTRSKTTATKSSEKIQQNAAEIPVPTLKLLSKWMDVFPTESVTLRCGMQSGSRWTYTWYKGTQRVQADSTVSFDSDRATLFIKSASAANEGAYKCEGHLQDRAVRSKFSSDLNLQVYDTGPRVLLLQKPTHSLMHTGDSVSFSCHVNVSSGWQYLWFKDSEILTSEGNNHTTIGSVVTTSSGSYQCQVKRGTNDAYYSAQSQWMKLDVKERPQAAITLLTGWSEVFSTDSLVLDCTVDDSNEWNYTWFKEEHPINSPPSEKHIVTPQNDPDQREYKCQGERNGRPSYSKQSTTFKTKNLLLKRRLLLSISGVIFFGIIAVFLGCIACRVLRKPDEADELPEDPNLFPLMPQLKDLTDTSCPLAEFITEAALNAPAREVEENGIICSETTQLPIVSPEDRDLMNDGNDQTENNGGLTSFQQ
uniref:Titin-like n=1 Tax=Gouania willdenowi TaxID=441366 RepID=A0A8C5D658_GOUWI